MKFIKVFLVVFLLLTLLLGSIYFAMNYTQFSSFTWPRYTNKTFGYSLQYPLLWTLDTTGAESKLDKTQPFCYYQNMLVLSAPNHMGHLAISYGKDCLGGQPVADAKDEVVTIDGQKVQKIYTAICTSDYPNADKCSNKFSGILYESTDCTWGQLVTGQNNDIACKDLKIHDQYMQISFYFTRSEQPKGYAIDDPAFIQTDKEINAIVSSIKLPIPPLHPEVSK